MARKTLILFKNSFLALLSAFCWAQQPAQAAIIQPGAAPTIYSLSYGAPGSGLIGLNANTFTVTHGRFLSTHSTINFSVAVDATGRIFGFEGQNRTLMEFDPVTSEVIHSTTLPGVLHGLASHNGTIYGLSYEGMSAGLIGIDSNTFAITRGRFLDTNSTINLEVAVDQASGRIFGFHGWSRQLMEYDPTTFQVIRSTTLSGVLHGLAVHNGTIYSLSYGAPGSGLIGINADTFAITQGRFLSTTSTALLTVAVDASGRIFGFDGWSRQLAEYDPATFEVIRSATMPGVLHGLAVASIPEPSVFLLLAGGMATLGARRRASHQR